MDQGIRIELVVEMQGADTTPEQLRAVAERLAAMGTSSASFDLATLTPPPAPEHEAS